MIPASSVRMLARNGKSTRWGSVNMMQPPSHAPILGSQSSTVANHLACCLSHRLLLSRCTSSQIISNTDNYIIDDRLRCPKCCDGSSTNHRNDDNRPDHMTAADLERIRNERTLMVSYFLFQRGGDMDMQLKLSSKMPFTEFTTTSQRTENETSASLLSLLHRERYSPAIHLPATTAPFSLVRTSHNEQSFYIDCHHQGSP